MKSLICSDIHDHVNNFATALKVANTAQCDSVICCGDLCAPFILDIYHDECDLPFHVIFGNNDGDRFHLNQKAIKLNKDVPTGKQIFLHGEFLLADTGHSLAGIPPVISIALYHYPEMARVIAGSGKYNVVCYGHSHKHNIEKLNHSIYVNPGSVMGYIPGNKIQQDTASCVIINWLTGELDLIEL